MMEIKYCKECFMPSSRPRIQINSLGVCNGCTYNRARKNEVNWVDRKLELQELIAKSKTDETNETYDCVVGWSGGKDSSAVALKLKSDLGLNPLLVTFSPLIPTPEGDFNRRALQAFGFDSVFISPSIKTSQHLSKRFFIERGDPKVHWNAGINAATINIASALRIPIIFYAEHGESEYGGKILAEENRRKRTHEEILENQIGDDPINWVDEKIGIQELDPYLIKPELVSKLEILYFAHYFPWDVVKNLEIVENSVEFKRNNRGRTYGTFTDFDSLDDLIDDLYYYMQYIKFGFGRCLRDCARQIQRGRMDRSNAYELISIYDGEYPEHSIKSTLEFLKINEVDFMQIVDSHRRPDIWEKTNSGWRLKHPLKFNG